jgi:ATP-binding cassette subfamily B protein
MSQFPKTIYKFIWHFIRKQKYKFSVFVIAAMIWSASDAVFPYLLKLLINRIQDYHGDTIGAVLAVKGILIVLAIFWLVSDIILRVQGFLQMYTFPQFQASIREAAFNYVKHHSYDYFSSHFSGNIAKKISDLPQSAHAMIEIIIFQFITSITGVCIVLVLMWTVQPIFSCILFIWLCIHFSIAGLFVKFGNRLWEKHSESVSTLSGKIVDVLGNILNVRLFARGKYELNYMREYQGDVIKKAQKAIFWTEFMRIGLGLNGLLLIFCMIFTLLYNWSHGLITIGDFTQISM